MLMLCGKYLHHLQKGFAAICLEWKKNILEGYENLFFMIRFLRQDRKSHGKQSFISGL